MVSAWRSLLWCCVWLISFSPNFSLAQETRGDLPEGSLEDHSNPESPSSDQDFNVQIDPETVSSPSGTPEIGVEPTEVVTQRADVEPPTRWGKSIVSISAAQSEFSGLKVYEDLYGRAPVVPTLSAEILFWRRFVGIGLRLQGAYFSDRGHPSLSKEMTQNLDENENIEFTLVPIDFSAWVRMPLWTGKPIYIAAGAGARQLYHTETRINNSTESTTDAAEKPYVNQGSKSLSLVGAEVGVRLTSGEMSDGQGLAADALNLRAVYLNAFYHLTQRAEKKGMDLSGSTLGLGFNFEMF
jgi:hypothetical protein